jgi:hypothetical protein
MSTERCAACATPSACSDGKCLEEYIRARIDAGFAALLESRPLDNPAWLRGVLCELLRQKHGTTEVALDLTLAKRLEAEGAPEEALGGIAYRYDSDASTLLVRWLEAPPETPSRVQ